MSRVIGWILGFACGAMLVQVWRHAHWSVALAVTTLWLWVCWCTDER